MKWRSAFQTAVIHTARSRFTHRLVGGGGGTFERQAGLGGALTAEEQAPRLQGGGRRGVLLFHTKLPQLRQLLQEEKREEEEEEDPGDD